MHKKKKCKVVPIERRDRCRPDAEGRRRISSIADRRKRRENTDKKTDIGSERKKSHISNAKGGPKLFKEEKESRRTGGRPRAPPSKPNSDRTTRLETNDPTREVAELTWKEPAWPRRLTKTQGPHSRRGEHVGNKKRRAEFLKLGLRVNTTYGGTFRNDAPIMERGGGKSLRCNKNIWG